MHHYPSPTCLGERRELYSEKRVVFEERRLRVDNSPLGPWSEEFAQRSLANNYRWGRGGGGGSERAQQ